MFFGTCRFCVFALTWPKLKSPVFRLSTKRCAICQPRATPWESWPTHHISSLQGVFRATGSLRFDLELDNCITSGAPQKNNHDSETIATALPLYFLACEAIC